MRKTGLIIVLLLSIFIVSAFSAAIACAQDDDPVIFVISPGSTYGGGSGWYAGYVVSGQSGYFTLDISANGPADKFPVSDVKVIVAISEAAVNLGTLTVTIEGEPVSDYMSGTPAYYLGQGGVFAEPDYFGYNDEYIIPELIYPDHAWPDGSFKLHVNVEFSEGATEDCKVMFLCYGTDAAGKPARTPFSGGTMFVIPEYILPIMAIGTCFAAYGVWKKIKR